MSKEVLLTGIIGIVVSIVSAWCSWFFVRKRYNSEVDQNIIHNMSESLEFYKQLSDDNKNRLNEVLKRNEELEEEIDELRREVNALKAANQQRISNSSNAS